MKKKVFCLLLLLILPVCLLFSGCGNTTASNHEEMKENRFICIKTYEQDGEVIDIYVDKETMIMYACFTKRQSYCSGITAILNSDGTPMLWEGEL